MLPQKRDKFIGSVFVVGFKLFMAIACTNSSQFCVHSVLGGVDCIDYFSDLGFLVSF